MVACVSKRGSRSPRALIVNGRRDVGSAAKRKREDREVRSQRRSRKAAARVRIQYAGDVRAWFGRLGPLFGLRSEAQARRGKAGWQGRVTGS